MPPHFTWLQSLDAMIERDVKVKASCTKCRHVVQVDLVALREKLGGDYCLINKRTRCRMKKTCRGWNRFHYLLCVYRPLWDEEGERRWSREDWAREGRDDRKRLYAGL